MNTQKLTLLFAIMLLLAGSAYPVVAQVAPETPIKGTIPVTEGADLQALAKITLEQARDSALAAVPGATFAEGELEEEDGFLIFEIELTQNGQEIEVAIDAGDASVLQIEQDD